MVSGLLNSFNKTTLMKKILIPCDFSDASENALNYAVEMAQYLSAGLVLLHINQIPVMNPEVGFAPFSLADANKDSLDALKNLAQKIKITHPLIGPIDYYSEVGNVAGVIEDFDKRLDVDLIIMGITGHGSSLAKTLLGSSSVEVAKETNTPVLIVPPDVRFHKILRLAYACEYDPDMTQSKSLTKVTYFNTLFSSELFVVHVVEKGHELDPGEIGNDNYLERFLDNSTHRTFVLNENKVSEALLTFMKNNAIDLIVVEPKKHSFLHKLFSESVTSELAFNSPVPVLTVH
jgi:nucleotide-binding universal stress UspA family protein